MRDRANSLAVSIGALWLLVLSGIYRRYRANEAHAKALAEEREREPAAGERVSEADRRSDHARELLAKVDRERQGP